MILYGEDILQARIDDLAEDDEWTGWLFPSSQSASGHVISETISSRFKRLADDAGLTVAGSTPTAKMGRRFWYSTYSDARDAVIDDLEDVVKEQGAESPEVVYWNYLSDAQRRNLRREQMNDRLADAFDGVVVSDEWIAVAGMEVLETVSIAWRVIAAFDNQDVASGSLGSSTHSSSRSTSPSPFRHLRYMV
ncbi:hypothetical protein [Halarchaeum sp. P4]|uniref:hypothetical protein n=1 Tax=Halarchaeum sp. P4 TaxID=3421639 RepID=UPI003EB9D66F